MGLLLLSTWCGPSSSAFNLHHNHLDDSVMMMRTALNWTSVQEVCPGDLTTVAENLSCCRQQQNGLLEAAEISDRELYAADEAFFILPAELKEILIILIQL